MIKHIVCFQLKDNSLDNCQDVAARLMSMKEHIPILKDIQVGIDFLHSERSYDIILETLFDSVEDLARYQDDDYHCQVIKTHMHKVAKSSISVDYVIE